MQTNNSVWQFFSSVKLALVTLALIAITSIIGTIIPQKEALDFYVQTYGPEMAQFFSVLDIPDMYNSWWFLGLLFLLSFNLVICSIDRFPGVWKQITADGLTYPEERLRKMANSHTWDTSSPGSVAVQQMTDRLRKKGWKSGRRADGTTDFLFSQKGAWTRAGVYIVHASILVIFIGAVIGALAGFKGSIMIPETLERDRIFLYGTGEAKELGFSIRCNRFVIEFYPNGTPKEYTSSLTVLEDGKEILTKEIEVNDPLTHRGITFYQSSYEGYQDFVVSIKNNGTGEEKVFVVPFQKQTAWEEEGLKFGVINAKALGQSIVSAKLWFSDGQNSPTLEWLDDGASLNIASADKEFLVSVKQMYATGLQVARDPGVWWVYIGCGLMLFGLYAAFFMSHRRIWIIISPEGDGSQVLLAGTANKNRPGFEKMLSELKDELSEDISAA